MNLGTHWRQIVKVGLIGSVMMLYVSMVGIVETFSARQLIGASLTLGNLFLFSGALAAGFLTARAINDEKPVAILVGGLLAGLLAGALPVLLVFAAGAIDLRQVFVNVSPALINILTFGRGAALGSAILLGASALLSLLAVAFTLIPFRFRYAVSRAIVWTLSLAIFSEYVRQILSNVGGGFLYTFIFQGATLRPLSSVILLLGIGAIYFYRARLLEKREASAAPAKARPYGRTIQIAAVAVLLLALPWISGRFLSNTFFIVGYFVLMGLGLNIVVGYAGLLDLGYVAFFAFGAYSMGLFTTLTELNIWNLNFWTAIPLVVLFSVTMGLLLGFPVLRMRGDYLAIVTLGFGEIMRLLALSDWLAPIAGGAQGVLKIPSPSIFGFEFDQPQLMYYLPLVGAGLAAFLTVRLRNSRLGRQWMAMREDEDVAEAMGINLIQTKLLAFAIGAGFSGLAGAVFAGYLGTIYPHSFSLLVSINTLALIIVGGLASIPGVVVGALILVGMPELLREFDEYRLLFYGILLIVMMLIKPEGFLPSDIIKRELHAREEAKPVAATGD